MTVRDKKHLNVNGASLS